MNVWLPFLLQAAAADAASAATVTPHYHLNGSGWFTMIVSVGFVTVLFVWCIARVLAGHRADKVQAPVDIDPHDAE